MIDFKSFIEQNLDVAMKEALSKMPPKQQADVNRLIQTLGKSLADASEKGINPTDDIQKAHGDFKERLARDMESHDKMQKKYGNNSK